MYGVEGGALRYKLNAVASLFKSFKLAIIQGVFTFQASMPEWKTGLRLDVKRVVPHCTSIQVWRAVSARSDSEE